ncbi:MAG: ADP-ribosylglycohydrolase family protein [Chloroflexi bacterium]|nr:ADP-ribosylglycohydrolase family protein [Chloroflexota bacterium]
MEAQAIVFGLALGDALGWPTEFLKLHQIKARYGAAGIQQPPDPALFTDDTQMTIALTEGLLDAGVNAPLDTQMQAVSRRFIAWMHSPENDRAPGATCMAGVRRLESGMAWQEAGIVESKGCGSAMRVATIGYLYRQDSARLRAVAAASSALTHRHPAAVAAAVGAAYLVQLALNGSAPDEYLRRVLEFTDGMSDEFDMALYRVGHCLHWGSEEAALDHIGQGWTGDEAVALALYCVLRYPNDYAACVRRAANSNGDSDSIACIAGGIVGARLGLEAIPESWRARCEKGAYLAELARRMAAAAP